MPYQQKITEWIQIYLEHIQEISIDRHVNQEEGYKFEAVDHFQKNFNLETTNLAEMLKEAIPDNNLSVGAGYWPRIMLIKYAEMFPEETRIILRNLFDNTKDIGMRITKAEESFRNINEKRNYQIKTPAINTFIGLRFLSLLVAYHSPNLYNAIKPSEWKLYVHFIDPNFSIANRTPVGKQYEIYEKYIEYLRTYIKDREDIKVIKDALTKQLTFKDNEYRWMAQDIIYVTAHTFANRMAEENSSIMPLFPEHTQDESTSILPSDEPPEENTGFMPLEAYLEGYIMKNWNIIDFGEKLSVYREEDGTPGEQYTTEVGVIDILAKDSQNNFVVIELKRADAGYKVVGQVLNYMGWIKDHLTTKDQQVRGMIIVGKADKTLKSALRPVSDKIGLKEYHMKMSFMDPQ